MSNAPFPPMPFDHTGISVRDLEVSVRFYGEVLGFSTCEETFELKGRDVRGAVLVNADGVRIELFERKGSRANRIGDPIEDTVVQGWFQLAFAVDDVQALFDRTVAAGAKPLLTPRVAPDGRSIVAFIGDPDNNLVEFLNRRPG